MATVISKGLENCVLTDNEEFLRSVSVFSGKYDQEKASRMDLETLQNNLVIEKNIMDLEETDGKLIITGKTSDERFSYFDKELFIGSIAYILGEAYKFKETGKCNPDLEDSMNFKNGHEYHVSTTMMDLRGLKNNNDLLGTEKGDESIHVFQQEGRSPRKYDLIFGKKGGSDELYSLHPGVSFDLDPTSERYLSYIKEIKPGAKEPRHFKEYYFELYNHYKDMELVSEEKGLTARLNVAMAMLDIGFDLRLPFETNLEYIEMIMPMLSDTLEVSKIDNEPVVTFNTTHKDYVVEHSKLVSHASGMAHKKVKETAESISLGNEFGSPVVTAIRSTPLPGGYLDFLKDTFNVVATTPCSRNKANAMMVELYPAFKTTRIQQVVSPLFKGFKDLEKTCDSCIDVGNLDACPVHKYHNVSDLINGHLGSGYLPEKP